MICILFICHSSIIIIMFLFIFAIICYYLSLPLLLHYYYHHDGGRGVPRSLRKVVLLRAFEQNVQNRSLLLSAEEAFERWYHFVPLSSKHEITNFYYLLKKPSKGGPILCF